jgi:rSAM/selenodomain-associated transferase 1
MVQALIIFVRNPEAGKVKTRLAATIGNEYALKVYVELLRHTRKITEDLPVRKLLFYAESIAENDNWPAGKFNKYLQPEGDLGKRMEEAFEKAYSEGASKVIIIGSDCYELTSELLEQAFAELHSTDAVIGPAADGGYYLMGFSALNRSVFREKNWSTNTVFQDTVHDLEKAGLTYKVLPVLNDVDEEIDLPEALRNLF